MKDFFKFGGQLNSKQSFLIAVIGSFLILAIWQLGCMISGVSPTILPAPSDIIKSFGTLYSDYNLLTNAWFSIKLNFLGYFEAILIALPVGFLIGLIPGCNALFSGYVNALRFLPITALTGIFILWFGIDISMKVHFLSFGILIYLLPVITQRIFETDKVHLQTIYTISNKNWHTFRHVYLPSALSRISDDIRVLVAISWTYIIVAELINKEGGIGAMIFSSTKQSRIDQVFAELIIIICIGVLQDLLFKLLDYLAFPFKYESSQLKVSRLKLILNSAIAIKIKTYIIKQS
jgi:NitT/TauT family transport system permease protein